MHKRVFLIIAYVATLVYFMVTRFDQMWPVFCPIACYIMPFLAIGYYLKRKFPEELDNVFQRKLIMVIVFGLFVPFILITISTLEIKQYPVLNLGKLALANVLQLSFITLFCFAWLTFKNKSVPAVESLSDKVNISARSIVVVPIMIFAVMGTQAQQGAMALNFGMETLVGTIATLIFFFLIQRKNNIQNNAPKISILKSPPIKILVPTVVAFAICIYLNFYAPKISWPVENKNFQIFVKALISDNLTVKLSLFGVALILMGTMLNFKDMYRVIGDSETIFEITTKLIVAGISAKIIAYFLLQGEISESFIMMSICCASMVPFVLKLALNIGKWEDFCAKFTVMLFTSMLTVPLMYTLLVG